MSATAQSLRPARAGGWLATAERRLGLTPTGLAVAGGAAIGWLAAYAVRSRVLFLMVYATVALLLALAVLGRRRIAMQAHRSKIPVRIREGQTVEVELEVTAKRRLGSLILEERIDRVRAPVQVLVPSVLPGEPVRHRYTFTPSLRGVYQVGPLTAIWTDPFGLTRKRTELAEASEILVHPSTESVHDRVLSRQWEDPPIRPPVSKPWPTGFEFYGMRDYVPGDDPRRIVWRAVARTGRYLVREAEQGITDRVTIIIDNDLRAHERAGLEASETFETAVRAVASLGLLFLKDGFVVAVESCSGALAAGLRGSRAHLQLLDQMARITLAREPLASAIARVLRDPRRDTHHILVTPHLDHGTAAMVRIALERGGSMTFVHVTTEDSDRASLRRAAALGCELVELPPDVPLEAVFRRGTGAGIRR